MKYHFQKSSDLHTMHILSHLNTYILKKYKLFLNLSHLNCDLSVPYQFHIFIRVDIFSLTSAALIEGKQFTPSLFFYEMLRRKLLKKSYTDKKHTLGFYGSWWFAVLVVSLAYSNFKNMKFNYVLYCWERNGSSFVWYKCHFQQKSKFSLVFLNTTVTRNGPIKSTLSAQIDCL